MLYRLLNITTTGSHNCTNVATLSATTQQVLLVKTYVFYLARLDCYRILSELKSDKSAVLGSLAPFATKAKINVF